jgi:protein SCO1/2
MIILMPLSFSPDPAISASKFAVAQRLVFMLCAMLVVAACNRSTQTTDHGEARHYEARGIVRGVAPDHRTIDIEHEDIPAFMPSMTMPFSLRDQKQIAGLAIGDAISFRLNVTDRDSCIDQINKISADGLHLPAPTSTPQTKSTLNTSARLREGDALPRFQLIDQEGDKIDTGTFRGHPFVLTFIFTRCPLPNFCPLMSKNFVELQDAIKNGSGPLAETRLLSISFDPEFDTPQILKSFAEHEQADPTIWTFAIGEKSQINDLTQSFSVYVQREGGTISHGLATELIDRDANIVRIWRGNGWAPAEIIREIETNNRQ